MDNHQHDYESDRPLVGPDGAIIAELPGAAVRSTWAQSAWSTGMAAAALFVIALLLTLLGGCEGRVSLFPNSDPELRKTPPEFAADAAKRFPYKASAPMAGEAAGRVSVDYRLDVLQLTNISDEDWSNVELWINKQYVVFLPKVGKGAAVDRDDQLPDDLQRSRPVFPDQQHPAGQPGPHGRVAAGREALRRPHPARRLSARRTTASDVHQAIASAAPHAWVIDPGVRGGCFARFRLTAAGAL